MWPFTRKVREHSGPSGGLFFFASLFSLIFLAVLNSLLLPTVLGLGSLRPLGLFLASGVLGAAIAHRMIQKHLSVFIHELKHSIASHFAGNKPKEMKINQDSGHFRYEFTKDTAHFNAFIALAPYCLPLCTLPTLGVSYLFWPHDATVLVAVVGAAFGADLLLNLRDISPYQTDLTTIRGGYFVGLTYVLAMNIVIATFLLAWVMQGTDGLLKLAEGSIFVLQRLVRRSGAV
ncbi:MAG: hypothetical protein EBZ48_09465 [Proteobacteria bacterium]|nr:hypothetical protein [Pseudomonadota bacterium]